METIQHIKLMLDAADCVIVPGLGAFVGRRIAATFDAKRSLLLPARRQVAFNQGITHNDGALVDFVSRAENITFTKAAKRVSDFATDVNRRLEQGEIVVLPGLGTLQYVGGEVAFKADVASAFLIDSYGYAPLPVALQNVSLIRHFGADMQQIKRLAATAAMIAGLLLVAPDVRDGKLVEHYSRASFAEMLTSPSAAETPEITEPEAQYHIIVASFNTRREADKYIAAMRQKGIDNLVRLDSPKRIRVSAATFTSATEAQVHNKAFRSISGFEKAWILKEE